jgi:hypothetical protein
MAISLHAGMRFLCQGKTDNLELRHIDANHRQNVAIGLYLSVGSTSFLHSLKIGDFLSQSVFRAMLLVRKINIDSSIQAQGTGDFMGQKRRIYGLSDKFFLGL